MSLQSQKHFIASLLNKKYYIYIYIRGGTVHRCHGSVRTSVRGSRFDTISVQQEKKIYYARFLFIYYEQTVVQITIFFHLDVKILNIITLGYIYKNLQYIYIHKINKFLKYIWFSLQINKGKKQCDT